MSAELYADLVARDFHGRAELYAEIVNEAVRIARDFHGVGDVIDAVRVELSAAADGREAASLAHAYRSLSSARRSLESAMVSLELAYGHMFDACDERERKSVTFTID